jgi:hypothetical protein
VAYFNQAGYTDITIGLLDLEGSWAFFLGVPLGRGKNEASSHGLHLFIDQLEISLATRL